MSHSVIPIHDIRGLPTIGETYLVTSVRTPNREIKWWPVIGNPHLDPVYFPNARHHFHYDLRFLNSDALATTGRYWFRETCSPQEDVRDISLLHATQVVLRSEAVEEGPVLREWTCLRQMPVYPTQWVEECGCRSVNNVLPVIERDHVGRKLVGDCRRCPHRGIPLNGVPVVDGVVVCPGHGLAFDPQTGEMVRRVTHPEGGTT